MIRNLRAISAGGGGLSHGYRKLRIQVVKGGLVDYTDLVQLILDVNKVLICHGGNSLVNRIRIL